MPVSSPHRLLEDHLPLPCWVVAAITVSVVATIIDRTMDGAVDIFFLVAPLLAVAWLAAAAAELSRAMNDHHERFRATVALLTGTFTLAILGPVATIWSVIATDRAMVWFGVTPKAIW